MNRIPAGSHSSKLQHRAPLEIRRNLSHVRKALEPGIPVPPCATSLDVVGQWHLCCAGASPTEGRCIVEEKRKRLFACPPRNYFAFERLSSRKRRSHANTC